MPKSLKNVRKRNKASRAATARWRRTAEMISKYCKCRESALCCECLLFIWDSVAVSLNNLDK